MRRLGDNDVKWFLELSWTLRQSKINKATHLNVHYIKSECDMYTTQIVSMFLCIKQTLLKLDYAWAPLEGAPCTKRKYCIIKDEGLPYDK